jgi:hypothetical protein
MGWDFEVEYHGKIPYEYGEVDGLFVETLESCIVDCLAEWSYIDAFCCSAPSQIFEVLTYRLIVVDFEAG